MEIFDGLIWENGLTLDQALFLIFLEEVDFVLELRYQSNRKESDKINQAIQIGVKDTSYQMGMKYA